MGERLPSDDMGGGYDVRSRTSQAAAHVTRTITLQLQFQPQFSL